MPPLACSISGNAIGDEGASALAAILKETQIQKLECAAAPERSLLCQCPLTEKQTKHCLCAYRLDWNKLGPEGGAALAEGIKGNSTLTSLS